MDRRRGSPADHGQAGIIPHTIPIAEFSVTDRDRQDYLCALLFEIGYAVADRSANPAAPRADS